jgi:dienelactone hydrolase
MVSRMTTAIASWLRRASLLAAIVTTSATASAEVHGEALAYRDGDLALVGFLAYDDAQGVEKRPAILIAPEWRGLDDYAKSRAKQLAALGYVALALDPYGKGQVAKDNDEAGKLAGALKNDRPAMRKRARAALDALSAHPLAAQDSVAAIGYCFGGTMALELLRDGAPLRAVVTVHGGLAPGKDAQGQPLLARRSTTKVLALHGGDDPFVSQAEVAGFMDEMRAAGIDWQLVQYGGAVHSFSNPRSGDDPSKGVAYNQVADRRSWAALTGFLADIFPR